MIKTMVWDPKCKYLCPSESTEASSSNEGMPQKFDTPSEADIMAEFPQDMFTPEVKTSILNMLLSTWKHHILNVPKQCHV